MEKSGKFAGFFQKYPANADGSKKNSKKKRQTPTDDSKNQVAPQGENLSFDFMFLNFYVQKCLGNDHKILSVSSKNEKMACGALEW